jgi:hypothetical protein
MHDQVLFLKGLYCIAYGGSIATSVIEKIMAMTRADTLNLGSMEGF